MIFCVMFLLKRISRIVVWEWREGEKKRMRERKTTCRHRFLLLRRSMITLDWLSSAFRRVRCSSLLIFTHYLLFIVASTFLLLVRLLPFIVDELYTHTHSNKNLTVPMCLVSIQTANIHTHIHIFCERKRRWAEYKRRRKRRRKKKKKKFSIQPSPMNTRCQYVEAKRGNLSTHADQYHSSRIVVALLSFSVVLLILRCVIEQNWILIVVISVRCLRLITLTFIKQE